MFSTIVCSVCDERLTSACDALRHHATLMYTAIELAHSVGTEEQRKYYRDSLVASFTDAQSAWAYREHLIEHGLLPLPSPRDVA
jgi:hypothetical protein